MAGWETRKPTGVLVLPDGKSIFGVGIGAVGSAAGEVCFNTAITGYQEILTDPSYSGQIVTFTFPHIGNVGTSISNVFTSISSMCFLHLLIVPLSVPVFRACSDLADTGDNCAGDMFEAIARGTIAR